MLADRHLDLAALWGTEWRARSDDLLRYFVKHVCCRIAEHATQERPTRAPEDLIAFLDGGPPPESLSYEMTVEPVQLRIEAGMGGTPLTPRWLGVDDL